MRAFTKLTPRTGCITAARAHGGNVQGCREKGRVIQFKITPMGGKPAPPAGGHPLMDTPPAPVIITLVRCRHGVVTDKGVCLKCVDECIKEIREHNFPQPIHKLEGKL